MFHLGDQMIVRLPSAAEYAAQVEKEHEWLPKLAPLLPLAIPMPLALGKPTLHYPWKWSVYRWIEGDTATSERIRDLCELASSLAKFLTALQSIDPEGGPPPGPHNFYRGGPLTIYDGETRKAIAGLKGQIDVDAATHVWESALATSWQGRSVWIHGDVSAGNLLLRGGKLSAVIDFGMLGIGDPACDLAIAWSLFAGESRRVFRALLPFDAGTWARGRGWALWKAAIVAAGNTKTNALSVGQALSTIHEVLADGN
jgi:aminoglycoside phosphotransferase (APT) family kinase protein